MPSSSEEASSPPARKRSFLRRQLLPTWAERKRTLRYEAWVLVLASYVAVAFAGLWPADFRNQLMLHVILDWAAFMVRTLAGHVGLVLILVAVVAAFTRQRRLLTAAVPIALVTTGPTWWQYMPKPPPPPIRGEAITVLSANLLMVNPNTDGIIGEIRAARPDIVLLQEYSDPWHIAMQKAIGADYPYAGYVIREDSFGTAIYSRRPFVGKVRVDVPLGSDIVPQMRAVIRIDGRDVVIYNIHLFPPRRLDYTIEARGQFADLLDALAKETQPLVVGGDFNFTDRTSNAAEFARRGLTDAHAIAGRGPGNTWPVNSFLRWLPGLRLDHLYLGGGLTCVECRTGTGAGSDHRPLIAKIGMRQ